MDARDAEKFTAWLNDLEVTENLLLYEKSISLAAEREILEKLSRSHNYSIIDIARDEIIGNCGYADLDHVDQAGEVGIFIGDKSYWNKGYGTEALGLLLDFGFKALNLHNIFLRVASFNERAIKSYEKVGFKVFGRHREALLRGDKR
ncbi:MAG: GNAT family N-acetyltransferase, partial [Treponema sp.]|nr:GNAT family N-acetyltransferase [Treponema sp.]